MKPEVRVIKKANRIEEKRDTIPIDRVLKTVEHIEIQAGRLLKMAQEVRAALTTK